MAQPSHISRGKASSIKHSLWHLRALASFRTLIHRSEPPVTGRLTRSVTPLLLHPISSIVAVITVLILLLLLMTPVMQLSYAFCLGMSYLVFGPRPKRNDHVWERHKDAQASLHVANTISHSLQLRSLFQFNFNVVAHGSSLGKVDKGHDRSASSSVPQSLRSSIAHPSQTGIASLATDSSMVSNEAPTGSFGSIPSVMAPAAVCEAGHQITSLGCSFAGKLAHCSSTVRPLIILSYQLKRMPRAKTDSANGATKGSDMKNTRANAMSNHSKVAAHLLSIPLVSAVTRQLNNSKSFIQTQLLHTPEFLEHAFLYADHNVGGSTMGLYKPEAHLLSANSSSSLRSNSSASSALLPTITFAGDESQHIAFLLPIARFVMCGVGGILEFKREWLIRVLSIQRKQSANPATTQSSRGPSTASSSVSSSISPTPQTQPLTGGDSFGSSPAMGLFSQLQGENPLSPTTEDDHDDELFSEESQYPASCTPTVVILQKPIEIETCDDFYVNSSQSSQTTATAISINLKKGVFAAAIKAGATIVPIILEPEVGPSASGGGSGLGGYSKPTVTIGTAIHTHATEVPRPEDVRRTTNEVSDSLASALRRADRKHTSRVSSSSAFVERKIDISFS